LATSSRSALDIIVATALAGTLSAVAHTGTIVVPAVVIELVLGILIGPHVAGLLAAGAVGEFGPVRVRAASKTRIELV
jgi:hypothetical protein